MPRAAMLCLAVGVLAGCHRSAESDAVREHYDRNAAAVDQAAGAQPTETGRKIYAARADALREEGRDRQRGMNGGTPSSGPASTAQGR